MKSSDLDERVKKLTERNDRLVDDLRDSETAAATANGGSYASHLSLGLLWACNDRSTLCSSAFCPGFATGTSTALNTRQHCSMCLRYCVLHTIEAPMLSFTPLLKWATHVRSSLT